MENKIVIKNLTIKNILNFGAPLFFLGFIYSLAFNIGIATSGILRNFLIFLYLAGLFMTLLIIEYFSTKIIINENGLTKKSLFFSNSVKWTNIKSLDVQITVANRFTKTLDKKEIFDDFYIGKKEILISNLENQLNKSKFIKLKKIIRLPFTDNIIEILKKKNLL